MKQTTASIYFGFLYLCTSWAHAMPLSVPPDPSVLVSVPRAPPACPRPTTPHLPPGALSPCPSNPTAGSVSSSPQPCPAMGPSEPGPPTGPRGSLRPLPGRALIPRCWGCPCVPQCPAPGWGGTGPGCQAFGDLNSFLVCFVGCKLGHFFNLYCFLLTMGIAQTFLLPSLNLSQRLRSGRSHCSAF